MRTYVFYHNADFDGVCSAALFAKKWRDASPASEPRILHSAPIMHGINYADNFPWDILKPEDHVFMVDFSLPMEDMKRLNDTVAQFTWIDHHKTAMNEAAEVGFAPSKGMSCDTKQAACELVWWYLFPSEKELHRVVKLLGRHDVWDHSDPDTLPFQYGMRACMTTDPNAPIWSELLAPGIEFLPLFRQIRDKGDDVTLKMNGKGEYAGFMYSPEGGIDVGAICAKLGGGGHTHAAGFRVKEIPFTLIEE